jgi:hypothetical protein
MAGHARHGIEHSFIADFAGAELGLHHAVAEYFKLRGFGDRGHAGIIEAGSQ